MSVVRLNRRRRRFSVRYYICTDGEPFRVPLRLFRRLVSGEVALPQFANSLQRFVEVLLEEDVTKGKTITTRNTSIRFDADGKVDLGHAAEVIAVLVEVRSPNTLLKRCSMFEPR